MIVFAGGSLESFKVVSLLQQKLLGTISHFRAPDISN